MDLIQITPNSIIDEVNLKNNSEIGYDDVTLSVSTVSDNGFVVSDAGNTMCRMTAVPGNGYEGEVLITYDRVDVNDIRVMLNGTCLLSKKAQTIHQALPYFEAMYGIHLRTVDFEDGALVWTGAGVTFTLKAKTESLLWQGNAAFSSKVLPEDIGDFVSNAELYGYDVLEKPDDRYYAEALVYGINFTDEHDLLASMSTFYDRNALVAMLNRKTDIVWTRDNNPDMIGSMHGSVILYNGINSGVDVSNKSYKYVLVVGMRYDSNVIAGNMILHYNDLGE